MHRNIIPSHTARDMAQLIDASLFDLLKVLVLLEFHLHVFSAPPQRCTMATTPGDTQTKKREVAEDNHSGPARKKAKLMRFLPAPCNCDCQNGLIELPGACQGVKLMQCPCRRCGGGRCLVMAMPMLFLINLHMGLEPVCGGCTIMMMNVVAFDNSHLRPLQIFIV